jgi:serine/threonine protein kinase/Tfp pilus assembly protein PilF
MTWEEFKKRYDYDPKKDKLDEGGFGEVYKAYDKVRGRRVALKVAVVKQEALRLAKEASLAASLPLHRNIAIYEECYTFEQYDKECDYGVLQYYEDGNLKQLLTSNVLHDGEIASILAEILEGVAFLHEHKILHRDLKPQNILIARDPDGSCVPKIADFGISKQVGGDESLFTNTLHGGTVAYASPEQLRADRIRWNADLWSFGVIAYQAFIGKLPFTTGAYGPASELGRQELIRQITQGQIPDSVNQAPEPWQGLIRRCLEVDAEQRIKSVAECLEIVRPAVGLFIKHDAAPDMVDIPTALVCIECGAETGGHGNICPDCKAAEKGAAKAEKKLPKWLATNKARLAIGAAAIAIIAIALLAAARQSNKNQPSPALPAQAKNELDGPDGSADAENQKPEQPQEALNAEGINETVLDENTRPAAPSTAAPLAAAPSTAAPSTAAPSSSRPPRQTAALAARPDIYADERAEGHFEKGEAFANQKNYDMAILEYTEAIKLRPGHVNAYNSRGRAHEMKGEFDSAIADYTQAIAINPYSSFAYANRGFVHNEKREYDKAIADYTQAIWINPKYASAYVNRAFAYIEKRDYDTAIVDLTQAIWLNPQSAVAYANRGFAYVEKRDHDRAIADYTEAIKINPNYRLAYENRARAHQAKGNKAQADADYAKARGLGAR